VILVGWLLKGVLNDRSTKITPGVGLRLRVMVVG